MLGAGESDFDESAAVREERAASVWVSPTTLSPGVFSAAVVRMGKAAGRGLDSDTVRGLAGEPSGPVVKVGRLVRTDLMVETELVLLVIVGLVIVGLLTGPLVEVVSDSLVLEAAEGWLDMINEQ